MEQRGKEIVRGMDRKQSMKSIAERPSEVSEVSEREAQGHGAFRERRTVRSDPMERSSDVPRRTQSFGPTSSPNKGASRGTSPGFLRSKEPGQETSVAATASSATDRSRLLSMELAESDHLPRFQLSKTDSERDDDDRPRLRMSKKESERVDDLSRSLARSSSRMAEDRVQSGSQAHSNSFTVPRNQPEMNKHSRAGVRSAAHDTFGLSSNIFGASSDRPDKRRELGSSI
jgi:hypothetical protein